MECIGNVCPTCKSPDIDWGYDPHYHTQKPGVADELGQEGVCEDCGTRIYVIFRAHRIEVQEEDQDTGDILNKKVLIV